MGIWSRKPIDEVEGSAPEELERHLGLGALIMMGVGGTIGAGIFVLTGTAAANYAGPAVALSFVIAGFGCLFAALCYAELASMIPVSGSAYTYAYSTMGELVAWIIGWNLILEYLFSAATVAVGWSGYFSAFLNDLGVHLPAAFSNAPIAFQPGGKIGLTGALVNAPAVVMTLGLTALLHFGIRGSAIVNGVMVLIKIGVVLLVIACGAAFVVPENWTPFVPANTGAVGAFGWSGVVRAAGVVFFAYIGFDMVSSSANEARNPRRDIPLALMTSLGICTALYIGMCLVMTGLAPYQDLNVPHPVFVAIAKAPALMWLKPVVSVGAIVGLASAALVTLYGQTRIFYAMGRDRLLPSRFAEVDPRHKTPGFGTWFVGICASVIAGVLPIAMLGELASIGTLLAFAIVCVGVLVLRRTEPDRPRGFRAPILPLVATAGVLTCGYMMLSLPLDTWIRFVVWLTLGMIVYYAYSRKRSRFYTP